jgi:hypothetical protein
MGLDGYAPGCVARAPPTLSRPLAAQQSETTQAHQGSIVYHPGEVLTVTNRLEYAAPLLSLLLHPQVPTGWDLLWVQGDGNPELIAGEIVWTAGAMPSSPVTVVYGIQVPISSRGPEHVTCDVEYHLIGETNPRTEQLLPDPLLFYWQPSLSMQSGPDNFSLSWQAGDTNFVIEAAESLIAPIEWRPLAELPEIGNDRVFVTVDRASAARYFRLRRKSVELLLLP